MRGTVLYGHRDVRSEERSDPTTVEPTEAVSRPSAACVCGSDLWPYRGLDPITEPMPMGGEYVGIVEEVGPPKDTRSVGSGWLISSPRSTVEFIPTTVARY